MRRTIFLLSISLLFILASTCKKEKVNLTDPIPEITGLTISPTTIIELQDSIIFQISYRDGDGDLGENKPNVSNLFLIDNRINVTESFRIRELAPAGSDIPISGTLRVVLRNTGITDNSNAQTFNYTVYLKDRAGHESNRFISPDLTVRR